MSLKDREYIRFSPLILAWQVLWPWLVYETVSAVCTAWLGRRMEPLRVLFLTDAAVFAVLYRGYKKRRDEKRKGSSGHRFMEGTVWAVGFLMVFSCSVSVFFNMVLKLTDLEQCLPSYKETGNLLFQGPLWLMLLVMAAAAPAAEELIFRGMIYERLRSLMGIWASAGISAALFGVFHGNALQGFYAFFLGIFLALVYERLDGLSSSILFHAGANLASLFMTALSRRFSEIFSVPAAAPGMAAASGILVLLCLTVFFAGEKGNPQDGGEYNIERT